MLARARLEALVKLVGRSQWDALPETTRKEANTLLNKRVKKAEKLQRRVAATSEAAADHEAASVLAAIPERRQQQQQQQQQQSNSATTIEEEQQQSHTSTGRKGPPPLLPVGTSVAWAESPQVQPLIQAEQTGSPDPMLEDATPAGHAVVAGKRQQPSFLEYCAALQIFANQYRTLPDDADFAEMPPHGRIPVGSWLEAQRTALKDGRLEPDQKQRIEVAVGCKLARDLWQLSEQTWCTLLRDFVQKRGCLPAPNDTWITGGWPHAPLGQWLQSQCAAQDGSRRQQQRIEAAVGPELAGKLWLKGPLESANLQKLRDELHALREQLSASQLREQEALVALAQQQTKQKQHLPATSGTERPAAGMSHDTAAAAEAAAEAAAAAAAAAAADVRRMVSEVVLPRLLRTELPADQRQLAPLIEELCRKALEKAVALYV